MDLPGEPAAYRPVWRRVVLVLTGAAVAVQDDG